MSTSRGYSGTPRHTIQNRTYRDCTECGAQTWAKSGVCTRCNGRAASRREAIISERRTRYLSYGEKVPQVVHLLRTTTLLQKEIARKAGVPSYIVNQIRLGRTHTNITGGYILRPNERGS